MQTEAVGNAAGTNPTAFGMDAFRELQMEDFLKLMMAELKNQDPLDPMDNAQMLEQISQMRQIQSSEDLRDTLSAVLMGQNMATASNLIGQTVYGLTDDGEQVSGTVDRVSIVYGVPQLHVGDYRFDLRNVAGILAPGEAPPDEETIIVDDEPLEGAEAAASPAED